MSKQSEFAVILGLNQPLADLARGFAAATHPIVKGFMVGRSLWGEPARGWLRGELSDDAFVAAVAANFETLVDAWRASRPRKATAPATLRANSPVFTAFDWMRREALRRNVAAGGSS